MTSEASRKAQFEQISVEHKLSRQEGEGWWHDSRVIGALENAYAAGRSAGLEAEECLRAYWQEHQNSATCNGKYPKDTCNCTRCKRAAAILQRKEEGA